MGHCARELEQRRQCRTKPRNSGWVAGLWLLTFPALIGIPSPAQDKAPRATFVWLEGCSTTGWHDHCQIGWCPPGDVIQWMNNWTETSCDPALPALPTITDSVYIPDSDPEARATFLVDMGSDASMYEFEIRRGNQLNVAGTVGGVAMTVDQAWFNYGTVIINSNASGTATLDFLGSVSIQGTGEIQLNGVSGATAQLTGASMSLLTNVFPHVIRGAGSIQAQLANASYIIADQVGAVLDLTPVGPAGMVNSYVMEVESGCTMEVHNATGFGQTLAGRLIVDGTLSVFDGALTLNAGTLEGDGTVEGAVVNTLGIVLPGGAYVGDLDVAGAFSQAGTGTTTIKLSGTTPITEYDQLHVSGLATLSGNLFPFPIEGFIPQPGQSFTVMTTGSQLGTFSQIITSGAYDVSYSGSSVTLTCTQAPNTPDIDLDGIVTIMDLCRVASAFGLIPPRSTPENMDGNDRVDIQDLVMVGGSWPATLQ